MKKITTLLALAFALTAVTSASAGDMKAKCDKMMKMDQSKMTDKDKEMMKKCSM
ncbi:MAG: hypothetical protein QM529_05320 [Hydrotalea sp.]|nr:hypothetical protein [Hydrotalea sp.]